ncbi:hypothetical protein N7490_010446 [Penicillium lividum]|nr:hypothetical protein N7490_010446 [Penicillium lividum]
MVKGLDNPSVREFCLNLMATKEAKGRPMSVAEVIAICRARLNAGISGEDRVNPMKPMEKLAYEVGRPRTDLSQRNMQAMLPMAPQPMAIQP